MSTEEAASPRRRTLEAAARVALASLVGVKLVLLVTLAVTRQYVMDELYQGGFSQHVGEFYRVFDPIKTVLFAYFFLPARWLAEDSVELMTVARLQAAALAAAMAILSALLARRLGLGRREAAFAACVLLSFSTFFERSIEVRSDTLAVTLGLAAWWVALGGNGTLRLLSSGTLLGLAFCSTQKASYMAVALGLGLCGAALARRSLREALREGTLLVAGTLAVLCAYGLAFGGLEAFSVLERVFTSPAEIAFHADDAYTDLRRYVVQTLTRDAGPYLATAAGLAAALAGLRRGRREVVAAWIATVVLAGLVFAHNQPWPYVFVMLLPALAPWAAHLLARVPAGARRDAVLLAATVVLAATCWRNVRALRQDNVLQAQVMLAAERLLGPEDRYADGIGMLPMRRQAARSWWDHPTLMDLLERSAGGDTAWLRPIAEDRPKVFILTYRSDALWNILSPLLVRAYVQVAPNILLAGARLEDAPRAFDCAWPGEYELRDGTGRPLDAPFVLDGKPVRGRVSIAVGLHVLARAEPGAEAWLVPADVPHDLELGPWRNPWRLFDGIYTF